MWLFIITDLHSLCMLATSHEGQLPLPLRQITIIRFFRSIYLKCTTDCSKLGLLNVPKTIQEIGYFWEICTVFLDLLCRLFVLSKPLRVYTAFLSRGVCRVWRPFLMKLNKLLSSLPFIWTKLINFTIISVSSETLARHLRTQLC